MRLLDETPYVLDNIETAIVRQTFDGRVYPTGYLCPCGWSTTNEGDALRRHHAACPDASVTPTEEGS